MTDYQKAATKALEILDQFGINSAPVDPLPILKKLPGVIVMSYEEISNSVGMERHCVMSVFGDRNQDAFTSVCGDRYLVTCNQRLPFFIVQRALARELGHIVLGHDGTRPEKVRNEEAKCFAHHLLCPRPLLHSIKATGLRITTELINNLTGCNDFCFACMRRLPGVETPAELNRSVRDRFLPYIVNFFEFQQAAARKDGSALADLGTYMEGYAE